MKKTEIERVLKASLICGLKVVVSRSMAGEKYTSIVYNKAGDTAPFNPLIRVGDAMELLLCLGGTLIVKNESSECFCYLEKDYPSDLVGGSVRGCWQSAPKNKNKNICNAIVNLVITKGGKK